MFRLFHRPRAHSVRETIDRLYGAIVAQARRPVLYAGFGAPDTVDGRFDLVVLHLVLVLRRLRAAEGQTTLGEGLFAAFCRDMDHNLREIGIADLAVPKRMKRMGEAFFGRQKAYEAALDGHDAMALEAALARNVYAGDAPSGAAARLARYVLACVTALDSVDSFAVPATLAFADPDAILRETTSNN